MRSPGLNLRMMLARECDFSRGAHRHKKFRPGLLEVAAAVRRRRMRTGRAGDLRARSHHGEHPVVCCDACATRVAAAV